MKVKGKWHSGCVGAQKNRLRRAKGESLALRWARVAIYQNLHHFLAPNGSRTQRSRISDVSRRPEASTVIRQTGGGRSAAVM